MQFLLQLQGHNVTKLSNWGFPFSLGQFSDLIPDVTKWCPIYRGQVPKGFQPYQSASRKTIIAVRDCRVS